MKINRKGIDLIKFYEGYSDKAYLCTGKKWTIGWGSTRKLDGTPVKKGDRINAEDAEKLFLKEVASFERDVRHLLGNTILNDNQFSALVSFAYNVGSDIDMDNIAEGLGDSTLLKIIKSDPNSKLIHMQFLKWNKSGGKVTKGLINRRKAESQLYYTK